MSELRRLVWRFETGSAPPLVLRGAFSDEISSILHRRNEIKGNWTGIMRSEVAHKASQVFDCTVDQARSFVTANSFGESLRQVELAVKALLTLEQAAAARARIDAAKHAHGLLRRLAGLDPKLEMSCLTIIDRLLDKSEKVFIGGDFRQSGFIAMMSQHEISRLSTEASDDPEVASPLISQCQMLQRVQLKCVLLGHLMGMGKTEAALARIASLIDDRLYVLSERLLDDLQFYMADELGFVSEVERQFGSITSATAHLITGEFLKFGMGSKLSLGASTQRLLEISLARVASIARALPVLREQPRTLTGVVEKAQAIGS